MASEHLLVERDGSVVTIRLNRPRMLNALGRDTISGLDAAVRAADEDATVGAIVLTGVGDRAFAAGADLRELSACTPDEARDHSADTQAVFSRIERSGTPVIAAINGLAYGGGCELAMACAMRIAADSARFAQPEINLGLVPGYGGSYRLAALVGRGSALEMLLTGEPIDAGEAWRIGLVNRVVPSASLEQEAQTLARAIAAKAPLARRYLMQAIHDTAAAPPDVRESAEARLFGLAFATDDRREGTAAFLEKRAPVFTGR